MVQSMTNTDTADIPGTIKQVAALARAGSEVVRVIWSLPTPATAPPELPSTCASAAPSASVPRRNPPARIRAADLRTAAAAAAALAEALAAARLVAEAEAVADRAVAPEA